MESVRIFTTIVLFFFFFLFSFLCVCVCVLYGLHCHCTVFFFLIVWSDNEFQCLYSQVYIISSIPTYIHLINQSCVTGFGIGNICLT